MIETIVGAGGVLVPPKGYVEGVRALCDNYGIMLVMDEVMVGVGRTGKMWCLEHFEARSGLASRGPRSTTRAHGASRLVRAGRGP